MSVIGFGEAMLRFAPCEATADDPGGDGAGRPSSCAAFTRSVGGDELNVMVALAKLGRRSAVQSSESGAPTNLGLRRSSARAGSTAWYSVLPEGRLGDVVVACARDAGVEAAVVRTDFGGMGCFHVLPDERRVHYERSASAFALVPKETLAAWASRALRLGGGVRWVHATGITPLLSEAARAAWVYHVGVAKECGARVLVDLNWRPALGTLEKLWRCVATALDAGAIDTLVLSLSTLRLVALDLGLEGVPPPSAFERRFEGRDGHTTDADTVDEASDVWPSLLRRVRNTIAQRHGASADLRLVCCFKRRAPTGLQQRWAACATADEVLSTRCTAVLHRPRDECGGGSAWAAGFIDAHLDAVDDAADGATTLAALHRADLLAALCQESVGDHSNVTRAELQAYEAALKGRQAPRTVPFLPTPAPVVAAVPPVPVDEGYAIAVLEAEAALGRVPVLAVLRATDADAAISRGLELAAMGCTALEVTLDTADFDRVLSTLVCGVPAHCVVGVGTLTDASQVPRIARLGARFALSPFNPPGMVSTCLAHGVLPVPAACTPGEIAAAAAQGATVVKVFPAQLWTPAALRDLRSVGDFGKLKLVPSGGVTPDTASEWLDAGAFAVGMGSKLVGGELKAADAGAAVAAAAQWRTTGRPVAIALFARFDRHSA